MSQQAKTTGQAPAAVGASGAQEPVKYETGKGCLVFVLVGLVLFGLMIGTIVVFGDPTPITG
jgi:hypothetical protein